jgi:hypothetical protein
MYRDVDGPTKPVGGLNLTCAAIPVHIVFGAVNDFLCAPPRARRRR